METASLAATTGRGCGPLRRSSTSQAGGSAWSALSSARETTPSWNSEGVAGRYTPSFFAAVAGFIVWVLWCDFMESRLSAARETSDHSGYPCRVTASPEPPSFRLAYVPGVTPAKWVRIWHERLPDIPLELLQVTAAEVFDVLRDGAAGAGFVRLPVDRTVFSAIPLYTETTVVVVPKDHVVTAAEEVSCADLAEETVLHPLDD